ncbi:DUF4007 family protein [Ktedonobacter racemifer]|uniref:DUF4007 domain-containing protein n=1 Tax=Ktedonobacter racemifer DSM 44963 TaxID=485913 RepID=D6TX57_KTERA|nr:DUF4007 family protein [Ktedonobacter racemifer]EFH84790.1 hypothetical protein Krac_5896 [Ktedonobacter racemifer DSM 44963]
MGKTMGFFQNFNLDLRRLSDALIYIQNTPTASQEELARGMSVNRPVAEGFSAWLRHTGLAKIVVNDVSQTKKSYQLTQFGELVARYDPTLSNLGTQWILHYYLSVKQDEASDAWYILINHYLPFHTDFTSDKFQAYFQNLMKTDAKNRSALTKDPAAALYTYIQPDALAKLHILERQNKAYVARRPNYPSPLIIGYMLFDWWQHRYDYTNTLRFSQLCNEEESIGRICLADVSQVRRFIIELTGLGYLSFSDTQHEPVNRLQQRQASSLLEQYYKQL